MGAEQINDIFQNAYDQISVYMSGPLGIVVGTVVGIAFFVMLIGMIMSMVNAFKGNNTPK